MAIRSPFIKAALGGAVAAALLSVVELIAHSRLGSPPPYDMVERLSQCALDASSDPATLDCAPGDQEDVVFPQSPDAERPRVVFLGASSVRLPRQDSVPDKLRALAPDLDIINLAVPGMGLSNVARISRDLADAHPDLVVIYAGHNEFSADVFRGNIQATRLWLLPVYGVLAESWIHTWLTRAPRGAARRNSDQRKILQTTDDTALRVRAQVLDRLESDLRLAIRSSPAPVLVSTLLRNAAFPPMGVRAPAGSPCAIAATSHGMVSQHVPLKLLEDCGPETAVYWWVRAREAHQDGDDTAARAHLARSLDLDPLPLRAPLAADDRIRRVAAETDAHLVDLEQAVGVFPDPTWFTDTLHFSPAGATAIAAELHPHIRAALTP